MARFRVCSWKVADWASRACIALHVHVSDSELRSIFANNDEPVPHMRSMEAERSVLQQIGPEQLHSDAIRAIEGWKEFLELKKTYKWSSSFN